MFASLISGIKAITIRFGDGKKDPNFEGILGIKCRFEQKKRIKKEANCE